MLDFFSRFGIMVILIERREVEMTEDTIRVFVLGADLEPVQEVWFDDAYAAEPFIDGVIENGYFVKVFVGDSNVSSLGE